MMATDCPAWCAATGPNHDWQLIEPEHVEQRQHERRIGVWSVSQQVERHADGTVTADRPEVDCEVFSFDDLDHGRQIAADLLTALKVLEQASELPRVPTRAEPA